MTTAICYKCGEFKFGAMLPCQACGATPTTDDDLVLSVTMTDHYFDKKGLIEIGQKIKNGENIELPPSQKEEMIRMLNQMRRPNELDNERQQSERKPWWRFW